MNRFETVAGDVGVFKDVATNSVYYVDYLINTNQTMIPLEKIRDRIVELLNQHGVE